MRRRIVDLDQLSQSIAALPTLSRSDLKDQWQNVYKRSPPNRISRALLLRALAYHIQESALGGLKPASARLMDQIIENQRLQAATPTVSALPSYKPGTRLLRQWHGETHEVILLDEGVIYRGERYRSLTQVAKTITGIKWNGPRFFGLRSREVVDAAR
jgi:hypothetical protein